MAARNTRRKKKIIGEQIMTKKLQKTVLRYAGGKSRAIKQIAPFVEDYDTIISPFLGGGSLEVHWASMGKKVISADIFGMLTNFWNELLNDPESLANELSKIKPTAEVYSIVKELLMCNSETQKMLSHWKTDFYKRDQIVLPNTKLAAYYYFNHNTSYGPGFLGWPSKIYMNQEKWDKTIEKIRNFSCPNLFVSCSSFEKMIKKYSNEFMYLDPPYYTEKDEDNKMLGGIYPMKNIPVHHDAFDHELLRDMLLAHDGDFVLSYNNCETIREYYSDFDFYFPKWHYSMDIGEKRIGKHRKDRTTEEELSEVDKLTQLIEELEESSGSKERIANLKSDRHEIMKKESHEILIVKKT
jgi:DNA adenine methylase